MLLSTAMPVQCQMVVYINNSYNFYLITLLKNFLEKIESKNRMTDLENLDITPTISEEHVLKRKDLNNHLAINQAYHLDLVYKNLGNRLEKLESTCEDYDRSSVVSLEHLKPNMNSQVSTDDYGYSGTGSVNSHMSQNIDILANHSEFDANSFYDSRIEPKFAETNLKLDLLEMNQKNLVNDITKLVQANEGLKQENYRFKESVKEYKTICADLHRALALTQVSLMSLEQRLLNQENTSHDGTSLEHKVQKRTNLHTYKGIIRYIMPSSMHKECS